ncbi:YHYH protein [Rheinheimera baltica]|uniref:YHYH protein n=1 Tax=Rheinheimera baltica TaxID=67576 RepID=A0ABT9I480_9GAMM|nr:YHYH protein [Rheinheimera baltica]MDP5138207.1 YHYH protein [Rheinheimera baltica]MDP5141139.1 YHYH protein [Rheinheimera baltica]MDP5148368.1 YHYH protein [Rheinheimera baltica]MDP5191336.1 YHYH protein [Rheinheimera baltica]
MNINDFSKCLIPLLATVFINIGCSDGTDSTAADAGNTTDNTTAATVDPELFLPDALVGAVSTENCTLSGGTAATCYRITIAGAPANNMIGPFCPPNIDSDATEGGIWFDGSGELYQLDGDFIKNLSNLYGSGWQLYNAETGKVNITDSQLACEAAARPNVDPAYRNYCVECKLEYTGAVQQTFLIPVTPVPAKTQSSIRSDVGIALNGVVLAPAAPVDAILSNYTIAAFDDCGGHINPFEGYHYHASTGCSEVIVEADGHAGLIGFALDGYRIYAMKNMAGDEDYDLDQCRGHSDSSRGYHYHAASAGENMFIGCFSGEQGSIIQE